jgi:hypothetical protein
MPTTNNNLTNGWGQWSQYVLASIKEIKELREEVTKFRVELAVLKIKVAFWGGVGAVAGTAVGTLLVHMIKEGLK